MDERYYSASKFFIDLFGEKVYRVSLDAGFSCPNRDGSKGYGGCIYCNEGGSRAFYVNPKLSIEEQLIKGIELIREKKKISRFLAYFQPFSNTYAPIEKLREIYALPLKYPEVVGISIGTRPDCIDEEKLSYLEELAKDKFVMIEYGVQTLNDDALNYVNRGHSSKESIDAILMTKRRKNIFVLAHLIFILPGDTSDQMMKTVMKLVEIGVDAFKFHHLYIEKNTIIEELYHAGKIKLLERNEYFDILAKVISILPPRISIHRLFGECRKEDLVAPMWTMDKATNISLFDSYLKERNIFQGCALGIF